MAMKRWEIAQADKELANTLAQECGVDPFAALIAASRGYTDAVSLDEYMSDELLLCDYRELAGINEAVAAVNDAIAKDELIAVYGDYDCDGITATALLMDYFTRRNVRAVYYIPDRMTEGYGMHIDSIKELHNRGVNTIITVDNGISAVEEVECANALGMRVVITDHHMPQEVLPPAAAVVDPNRIDCPSSYKSICGVAVAFKLVCALEEKPPEELLPVYADLVGIGTVGDVMPLTGENRSIVKRALYQIRCAVQPRKGVSALLQLSGIERSTVTAGKISFSIVPRINAAGRMGDASRAVKMLITDDIREALTIAGELSDENSARQEKERNIFTQAVKIIDDYGYCYDRIIVVDGEGWHHGIVGIVASRLVEHYGKPAIVLARDGDTATGSGRSFKGISLFDAINSARDITQRFGGHELAAGVTLDTSRIDEFRRRVNSFAASLPGNPAPVLHLDCKLIPSALDIAMTDSIKDLEPFGMGNPQPVFGLFSVKLDRVTPIGQGRHLRLLFSKDNCSFQALLFGANQQMLPFDTGDVLDLAVQLDSNVYNGKESLSVIIKGIRKSGIDQDEYFADAALYDMLQKRNTADYTHIIPSRAQIGIVYKSLRGGRMTPERVKQLLYPELSHFKTAVSLDVLCELGLADKQQNNGVVTVGAVASAPKSDLSKSEILKYMSGGERQ